MEALFVNLVLLNCHWKERDEPAAATEKTAVPPALTARLAGCEVMTGAGIGVWGGLMERVALDVAVPHELLTHTSTGKVSSASPVVGSEKLALVPQPVRGVALDSHK